MRNNERWKHVLHVCTTRTSALQLNPERQSANHLENKKNYECKKWQLLFGRVLCPLQLWFINACKMGQLNKTTHPFCLRFQLWNVERIVNASDYFMQSHNGIIPHNISVLELASLHGVRYKMANIVITSAFYCVEGIPSNIHVLRW